MLRLDGLQPTGDRTWSWAWFSPALSARYPRPNPLLRSVNEPFSRNAKTLRP